MFEEESKSEGCELITLLYERAGYPSVDFLIFVLNSLKKCDMFTEYREIVHKSVDSYEIWGYYIEYCVATQRITECLDSLKFYKSKCVIGTSVAALYNLLASSQIRFTIFQNQ